MTELIKEKGCNGSEIVLMLMEEKKKSLFLRAVLSFCSPSLNAKD